MTNRWNRALFCLLLCMGVSPILFAQNTWQEVSMRVNNEQMSKLRAIAIPAEAEYKGQKLKAYVFFYGREGRGGGVGYPNFGVYIERIESIVPESEIQQFVGPDLSQAAINNDAVKLSIGKDGGQESTSARIVYTDVKYFDTGLETNGFFQTNIRAAKSASDRWKHFLSQTSDGFVEGKAVIGGKAFSSQLTIRFSGNGLGAKLKELMAYCSE